MKKLFLTALAATALTCVAARAEAGAFFGARGGFEKYQIENSDADLDKGKTDYLLSGFVGYHSGFFRLEAEYMYHPERSFEDGDYKASTQTVMGNLFFSPPMKGVLHPYFMGGAGVALHSSKVNGQKDDNNNFAWQVGAGLELEFTEQVFLDCGARLVDMGKAKNGDDEFDVTSYLYYLGLRFEY